uniref:Uncharacterized protein n=1 Tax=Arundo donax TaxID=35708 RepID=A0A0A8YBW4_ARUDO
MRSRNPAKSSSPCVTWKLSAWSSRVLPPLELCCAAIYGTYREN